MTDNAPVQWDRSHQVPADGHPFYPGMRVVWLSSLHWHDSYQYGTVQEIHDVEFPRLNEIHTLAKIKWDTELTAFQPDRISSEAVASVGYRKLDIAPADTFDPNEG